MVESGKQMAKSPVYPENEWVIYWASFSLSSLCHLFFRHASTFVFWFENGNFRFCSLQSGDNKWNPKHESWKSDKELAISIKEHLVPTLNGHATEAVQQANKKGASISHPLFLMIRRFFTLQRSHPVLKTGGDGSSSYLALTQGYGAFFFPPIFKQMSKIVEARFMDLKVVYTGTNSPDGAQ